MFIARQKRKENIAEYLLYMWQMEDLIRSFKCDIEAIDKYIISQFPEAQRAEEREWIEGLVSDNGPLGGEGATPEQVIDALMEEEMPEGAIKNKEEYEDKKVEEFKKVSATRELLFSRTQRTVIVPVETVLDGVKTSLEFEVKRLSESENTHLFNHKLFGKELKDMTDEEYLSSTKFRSDVLAKAVVNPKLTAEEWRTKVDYGMLTAVYEAVNRVLTEADDATLFQ